MIGAAPTQRALRHARGAVAQLIDESSPGLGSARWVALRHPSSASVTPRPCTHEARESIARPHLFPASATERRPGRRPPRKECSVRLPRKISNQRAVAGLQVFARLGHGRHKARPRGQGPLRTPTPAPKYRAGDERTRASVCCAEKSSPAVNASTAGAATAVRRRSIEPRPRRR